MATTSRINQDSALQVRTELLAAIGSENNPNQWMHFMATVRRHLPEVLSRGRPSRQAIEASMIGALGFTTWRELLEAPLDQGGLALSWSTWRQWSRAWVVISERPALQGQPLTAAEVNRLASEAKAEGVAFPSDPESLARSRKRWPCAGRRFRPRRNRGCGSGSRPCRGCWRRSRGMVMTSVRPCRSPSGAGKRLSRRPGPCVISSTLCRIDPSGNGSGPCSPPDLLTRAEGATVPALG